jgi:hypothetical protein
MLNPGEPFPGEEGSIASSSSTRLATIASPSTASSPAAATSSSIVPSPASSGKSFPTAAIAGIVVGVVFVIALAAGLFYMFGRSRSTTVPESAPSNRGSVTMGYSSPAPPTVRDSVYGPDGTIFVPVKASDFSRMILSQSALGEQREPPNMRRIETHVATPEPRPVQTWNRGAQAD